VRSPIVRAILAALCADSADPILTDSTPIFGQKLTLQFFSLRDGYAYEPEQAVFTWNRALYALKRGGMDVAAFSVQPFEAGDDIIQEVPTNNPGITEYSMLHKLAEGVYQVIAIDEADADEQTRATYCKRVDKSGCRITTREQLLAFAHATQARRKDGGELVVLLPEDVKKPGKHRQRHRK
jgi:hypothetical protein